MDGSVRSGRGILCHMNDKDLYAKILGIETPWRVVAVDLEVEKHSVTVRLGMEESASLSCPECGTACSGYDTRERSWRHLDTCQYTTMLVAAVPRVECKEHGVKQVKVPWAEEGSRFTAMFEALAISWMKEASLSGVSRVLRLSWDEASGIQRRAVERGLRRRERSVPRQIGVDETAFAKRQQYVTVVCDLTTNAVVHVADGRGKVILDNFYSQFTAEELASIEVIAMDMWKAYICSTFDYVPDAERKIAFDKFHVAKHFGTAVDLIRRREHKQLSQGSINVLTGTRYLWLWNPDNMTAAMWERLQLLKDTSLKTAKAWFYKEWAMRLWHYTTRGWALRGWSAFLRSALRTNLKPVKEAARMVMAHLYGIINAVVLRVTNARAEGLNSGIQAMKRRACGYRNRENFRNAIMFHFGQLDLYPEGVGGFATHTIS